ncbi:fasciclin domain-containing protein [Azospirillum doebereinerae]
MKKVATVAVATLLFAGSAFAAMEKTVGGAPMYPNKTIVENASQSKDHTTLVAAVKAAGLVDTLSGKGPFTVFAPTNTAFDALPAGTVDTLLKPENKGQLTKVLTYHVVPGTLHAKDLAADIKKGNGKAMLKTVEGAPLTFTEQGGKIMVADAAGNKSTVTIADVDQSNGVVHVIDKVLLPK